MYDFNLQETHTGSFEVVVVIPREDKVIGGLGFPQAPITHRFTEAAAFSGQFDGLSFASKAERDQFTKDVGDALISNGAKPVAAHS